MNSADMFSLVPNADDLLALPLEEQGKLVLQLLAPHDSPQKAEAHVNFFNRAGDFPAGPSYGRRQREVDNALLEAWSWLESKAFLVKSSSAGGASWFYIGKAGKEFLKGTTAKTFKPSPEPGVLTVVADRRLAELRNIASPQFDFKKLVRLCEELNTAYQQECYFATAMLTRSLLDHVPPIFGKTKFDEVASNYGGKSFKGTMQHLQNASRNVADGHLHQQIRKSESLPTAQQVNCAQPLDVLLEEIVRITQEKGRQP